MWTTTKMLRKGILPLYQMIMLPDHSQAILRPKWSSNVHISHLTNRFCSKLDLISDHISGILTLYQKNFTVGKSGPTKNWPYTQKDLISPRPYNRNLVYFYLQWIYTSQWITKFSLAFFCFFLAVLQSWLS